MGKGERFLSSIKSIIGVGIVKRVKGFGLKEKEWGYCYYGKC